MLSRATWVNLITGVPQLRDFTTTGGLGSPICINTLTDTAYFLKNNVVTAIDAGGGGGDGVLNIMDFGAVADNATDCSPAMNTTIAASIALSVLGYVNPSIYRGGPPIHIPVGKYFFASSIVPLETIRIYGDGGLGWGAATQLRFAAGIDGFQFQAHNTSGKTTLDGVTHFAGDAIVLQDLYCIGGFTTTEGDSHGIRAKRAFHIERCTFDNFEGDGIYAHTIFGSGVGATEGNTNVSRLLDCSLINNRSGLSVQLADANAMSIVSCNFSYNRRWGIEDRSFLGNSYTGHHLDANARVAWNDGTAGKPASYCHVSGHHYFAIEGQEVGASTNAPTGAATSNTWWGYWKDGGVEVGILEWVSGMSVRSGGPIIINGLNNASTITGTHIEINGVCQIDQCGIIIGNSQGTIVKVSSSIYSIDRVSSILSSSNGLVFGGNVFTRGDLRANSASNFLGPRTGTPVIDGATTLASRSSSHLLQAQIFNSSGVPGATYASLGFYSGLGTILDTISPRWHRFRIAATDIVHIESLGLVFNTDKAILGGNTAAPTTGAHSRGEIVFNSTPSAGATIGWICITAGTPGIWEAVTGTQTITLTGDVTGSGTGSFAATIAADAVTYGKMQNVSAASKLLGRGDSGSGDVQEITLGTNLSMSGTTLNATGGGSGDVVGPGSAVDNAITRFDSTTGKLIQNSNATVDDDGRLTNKINSNACEGVGVFRHWIKLSADYTLTNSGAEQKLFDTTTNGALTLPTGTYFFDCLLYITTMSAVPGNMAFDPIGAGTAVGAGFLYNAVGADTATPTAAGNRTGSIAATQQSATSIVTADAATAMSVAITGTFRVTTGGTIIPSGTLVTAAAAVVKTGSYFSIWRAADSSTNFVGAWT